MSHATPHNATQDKSPKRREIGRKKLRKEEVVATTKRSTKASEKVAPKAKEIVSSLASLASLASSTGQPEDPMSYPHDLSVRIDTLLYEVVDNFVASANTGGDYSYTSVADFIREALRGHALGQKFEARAEGGKKKRLTLRVDDEVKAHYEGLPRGKRTEILERAIRTKLLA